MKIPITDQFLWDVYKFLEAASDTASFAFDAPYQKTRFLFVHKNSIFARYRKEKGYKQFAKLIYYLKSKNYIKVKSLEGKQGIMLTKEGISKALQASFVVDGSQKRNDGKWLMLTFDIPQKHKKARILLRSIMRNLGFKIFQHSIWVCPFDISDATEKLLQMHDLERYVKLFLIEQLEK